ncbi:hypothetical protein IWQ61_009181 [Dispira simplex]|nr:hypothetical protein IWQ61_009181 [Dispira simplex]
MSNKNNSTLPNIYIMFHELNKVAFWGILDNIKLEWVDDLGPSTKGKCTPDPDTKTTRIQLSKRALKSKSHDEIVEALVRQMLHAYLHMTATTDEAEKEGPNFKKHWERLLRIREEYIRKEQSAPKTSSGEFGYRRPGSSASSERGKGKAPTWNFRPGSRAHERKPEVVSSDDEKVTAVGRPNQPLRSTFAPSTSNQENSNDKASDSLYPPEFNVFSLSEWDHVLSFFVNWNYRADSNAAANYGAVTKEGNYVGGNFVTRSDPVDHAYTLLGRPPYININCPTKDLTLFKRFRFLGDPQRPTGYYAAFNKGS